MGFPKDHAGRVEQERLHRGKGSIRGMRGSAAVALEGDDSGSGSGQGAGRGQT